MNEIEDGVFIEFDFDHMSAAEFSALRKRVDERLIEVEDECLLRGFGRDQRPRDELHSGLRGGYLEEWCEGGLRRCDGRGAWGCG